MDTKSFIFRIRAVKGKAQKKKCTTLTFCSKCQFHMSVHGLVSGGDSQVWPYAKSTLKNCVQCVLECSIHSERSSSALKVNSKHFISAPSLSSSQSVAAWGILSLFSSSCDTYADVASLMQLWRSWEATTTLNISDNTATHPQRLDRFNQSSDPVSNMVTEDEWIYVWLFSDEIRVCLCVCTYRKGNLAQFVRPVIQLVSVSSKHKHLFCGFNQEGPGVFGTPLHLHLGDPYAVRQTDHLWNHEEAFVEAPNSWLLQREDCFTFLWSCCLRRFLSFFSRFPSLHSKNSSLEMEQELSL